MLQFFMNPWALFGIAGVGLAVIAHLISRRRFDVVQWGAMQFLNPARKTRRKLKLEELLLMLIRMAMIAILVLAASRPWLPSGMLMGYRSMGSRAVVVILDGSNSMSRGDGLNTLHQNAKRRAVELLQTLGPGDGVALIDARDQPRVVIESPLQDFRVLTEAIQQIPDPLGAINVQAAVEQAIAILGKTSATSREIVLLTDRQRIGWRADQDGNWARIEDLMTFPSVRPRLWTLDVAGNLAAVRGNIAVGQIDLTRELTVPDFPIRLSTLVRNNGDTDVDVPVRLHLDGQPLAGQAQEVRVAGRSEATVEFEFSIHPTGTHLISVAAEGKGDAIKADDTSHAAIHVASALPVLLINGNASLTAAERETFFAEIALTASGKKTPWVTASVIDADSVTPADINRAAMVILADVTSLPHGIAEQLVTYTSLGHGVFITLGPQTTPESFDRLYQKTGLLAGFQLNRLREAPLDESRPVTVAQSSLQSGWLDRFRSDTGRTFLKARYMRWWLAIISPPGNNTPQAIPAKDTDDLQLIEIDVDELTDARAAVPLASLTTGDPLLIEAACGKGSVLLLTSTISRRWNNFPALADFVPFIHEAVFRAASSRTQRNVSFGAPLIAHLPMQVDGAALDTRQVKFRSPGNRLLAGEFHTKAATTTPESQNAEASESPPTAGSGNDSAITETQVILTDTHVPGVYELTDEHENNNANDVRVLDRFVVNYDHSEDDIAELTADDRGRLAQLDRVRFVSSLDDLTQRMYGNEARTEMWAMLICLFPCLLLLELFVTRRLIQKGYSGSGKTSSDAAA